MEEPEVLFTAERFRVERVRKQMPDGEEFSRAIVRHPGAVVILPILSDGRICLIKNDRIAVGKTLIELPAGTREPEEQPIVTAKRELAEETGYQCSEIAPLCQFYMSPGILDEHMHVFVAKGLKLGDPSREFGEQIENYPATLDEIDTLIKNGDLVDAKSITAILYYLRFVHGK